MDGSDMGLQQMDYLVPISCNKRHSFMFMRGLKERAISLIHVQRNVIPCIQRGSKTRRYFWTGSCLPVMCHTFLDAQTNFVADPGLITGTLAHVFSRKVSGTVTGKVGCQVPVINPGSVTKLISLYFSSENHFPSKNRFSSLILVKYTNSVIVHTK